jgi:hypothetical protein
MNDSKNRSDVATSKAPQPVRVFVDGDSVRWHVYEKAFSGYDRRSGSSLIFASEAAVRRVRTYPADWQSLSDAQLAELSWKS